MTREGVLQLSLLTILPALTLSFSTVFLQGPGHVQSGVLLGRGGVMRSHGTSLVYPSFMSKPRLSVEAPQLRRMLTCITMQESVRAKSSAGKMDLEMGALQRLPRIFPSTELISRAKKKVAFVKEDTSITNSRARGRKFAAERINAMAKELTVPLGEVVDGFRAVMRRLGPFEKVVADLTVKSRELAGFGSLADTLTAVKDLRKTTSMISKSAAAAAAKAETRKLADDECELAMDEMLRLWESDGWILEQLLDMQRELKSTPMIQPDLITVVLVGSPNVGKSSIVRAVSTGTPEVNNYPFTTRGMTLGHILDSNSGDKLCQVMDTPGLLPRADEERNEMELLTLASMQHLESVVLFVMDLTGGSGEKSSIPAQMDVRDELKSRFDSHLWVDVLSKADLPQAEMEPELTSRIPQEAIRISTETGEGLGDLQTRVMSLVRQAHEAKRKREEETVSRWVD